MPALRAGVCDAQYLYGRTESKQGLCEERSCAGKLKLKNNICLTILHDDQIGDK
jgi:hypothetical protein